MESIYSINNEFYITIVDDSSPDGTGKIADQIASENFKVHVIHRHAKLGLGSAYLRGFQYAIEQGMDYIFEMDADFSHHPKYLPDMLEAIKESDLVIGSRYNEGVRVVGWPFRRLMVSKFANLYASFFLVFPVSDYTSGFRCFRRQALERIDFDTIRSDGYAFQVEMTVHVHRLGFKIKETPIVFYGREFGKSKISRKIV